MNWAIVLLASLMAPIALAAPSGAADDTPFLTSADAQFLKEITAAVVDASRVPTNAVIGRVGPNTTGATLIRPGGRECYPAFWIRDYAMSVDAALFTPAEQRHAILLTASTQQDKAWNLPSGSYVPKGAIADHITFAGKPIFYPGTLDDYEGQGGPQWGILPALDDHFYFIIMTDAYLRQTHDTGILKRTINGKTLLERLESAFAVPPANPENGLAYCDSATRGVNFGFFDTVTHTGELLFCSLLRYEAADDLAAMQETVGDTAKARKYRLAAQQIRQALPRFGLPGGMLKASTGVSAQPDVWGTAYAVYCGALQGPLKTAACNALAQACRDGQIAHRGNIRHVPTGADFSPASAWEKALAAKNTYQNGAYWGTATGWVCYAIAQVDRPAAQALAAEYVAELREGDFRKSPDHGSPWECFHPDKDHRQNPVYMASVTCPLAAFRRID